MLVLKSFQVEGVSFLTSHYHAILDDDMGLGKTVQAIKAMDAINAKKVLIVCPTTIKYNWAATILYQSDEMRLVQIIQKGSDVIEWWAEVVIISYDLLSSCTYKFKQHQFDLLICDEAHYLRGVGAKRTWAVLGEYGVARNCRYKWMLTGTPIEHKPNDLFPILTTLFNKSIAPYNDYEGFIKHFCGGYRYHGEFVCTKATNKEDLSRRLWPIMLRRTKKDVLKDLPPITMELVYLEPNAEAKQIIKEEPELDMSMQSRAELSRHRQELALAKIPDVLKYVEDMLEVEDKIVLFGYHHAVIDILMVKLAKYRPEILVGGMTDKQKQRAVNQFINRKEARIFIGNVEAAGTGVDGLQKVCSTEIFVEFDLRPGKIQQAVDRLHRMMQNKPVLAQFMVLAGSWEARKLKQVLDKAQDNEQILNRR